MPTRVLREGIIASARVHGLSMGAEILYRRLMSVVDDYGRFYGEAATVRAACWPRDPGKVSEFEVAEWLMELTKGVRPLVVVYSHEGCRYLVIMNFRQQARSKSKFPEPPAAESAAKSFEQPCLTNDVQVLHATRARTPPPPPTKETNKTPTKRTPPPSAVEEFPETARAIRTADPMTDSAFVAKIITDAVQAFFSVDTPKVELTDVLLAEAVTLAACRKKTGGAGLLGKTVPNVIANWARHGKTDSTPARPLTWSERQTLEMAARIDKELEQERAQKQQQKEKNNGRNY